MIDIKPYLIDFMKQVESGNIEVYNEFSLQHELGIFLRGKLAAGYKVQFERNVKFFEILNNTVKHEIDIVIYNEPRTEKYAIELKYPQNGQHPEQMYKFTKDIKFMEQLKEQGFDATYTLTMVNDPLFYQDGKSASPIYGYFRGNKTITGIILKPTGKESDSITINGSYKINWQGNSASTMRYYIVAIE